MDQSTESLLGDTQADTAATGGTDAADTTAQADASAQAATPPGETADGKQATEAKADEGAKEGDKPTGAPEKYEAFAVPEGYTLDATMVGEFEPVLRELNLSQADAQKVIDFAPKYAEQVAKQTATAVLDQLGLAQRGEWVAQIKADPELGGDKLPENLAIAKKARDAFFPPALREVLTKTGLADHPEMARALFRIGKSISEDSFVPGGKTKTPASFYENSNMNP